MRFWDSSAVVPLLLEEEATGLVRGLLEEDAVALQFWSTPVECASAVARREREGALDRRRAALAFDRLAEIGRAWSEVSPGEAVRDRAVRILRVHGLRAADSLPLAAAIVASEERPATLPFVCLDARLRAAAEREGFPVLPAMD